MVRFRCVDPESELEYIAEAQINPVYEHDGVNDSQCPTSFEVVVTKAYRAESGQEIVLRRLDDRVYSILEEEALKEFHHPTEKVVAIPNEIPSDSPVAVSMLLSYAHIEGESIPLIADMNGRRHYGCNFITSIRKDFIKGFVVEFRDSSLSEMLSELEQIRGIEAAHK